VDYLGGIAAILDVLVFTFYFVNCLGHRRCGLLVLGFVERLVVAYKKVPSFIVTLSGYVGVSWHFSRFNRRRTSSTNVQFGGYYWAKVTFLQVGGSVVISFVGDLGYWLRVYLRRQARHKTVR